MGTFRHGEFSARGIFVTGTFRLGDISAHGHFGTVAQVPICLCRNVHISLQGAKISMRQNVQVPKYPCAEMFRCRKFLVPKIPRAENTPCRNVPVLKSPSAETSAVPNGACAEMFPWWNIHAEMTLAEISGSEMVGSLFVLPRINFKFFIYIFALASKANRRRQSHQKFLNFSGKPI